MIKTRNVSKKGASSFSHQTQINMVKHVNLKSGAKIKTYVRQL